MFSTVRRFIKTAIGFLGVGVVVGVFMLVRRELYGEWPHPYLVSAHAHAMLVGFVMFLILGVALWLFPRAEKGDERYRPGWIDGAYWILLIGTAVRFSAELMRVGYDLPGLGWVIVGAGSGQAVGLGLYFWTMWTRIRPVGSHLREGRGERF